MIPITKANSRMSVVALARRSLPKNAMVSKSCYVLFELLTLTMTLTLRRCDLLLAPPSFLVELLSLLQSRAVGGR
jgi:hypothetical protein